MIGQKSFAAIRAELKAKFKEDAKDPVKWFNQQIRRLERNKSENRQEIDILMGLRDLLFKDAPRTRKKKVS